MQKIKTYFFLGLALLLAGCAVPPSNPTQVELTQMQRAPMPSSQKAAEVAVKNYFAERLIDPESARYQFRKPVRNGLMISADPLIGTTNMREFGVLMCGEINSKNRIGGYTGNKAFYIYFDPHGRDKIMDAAIDDDSEESLGMVEMWCRKIYNK